jgi:hypothetical protein
VFYRARQVLKKAGFVERLGDDRMWHSISAGIRAARQHAELKGKAHDQIVNGDDEDISPADERIAVDGSNGNGHNGDDDSSADRAPRGGYQDPEPELRRKRRLGFLPDR